MKKFRYMTMIVALGILMTTGCLLGPDYQKPLITTPLIYKDGAPWKTGQPQDAVAKGAWWTVYNDPTLNRLEEEARTANPDLMAAFYRVEQARANARVSEADRLPRVDLNPSALRTRESEDFSALGDITRVKDYRVPFDLSYEVDLWGRVRRSVEAAHADYQASRADYETVLLTLQAEVARNYFSLCSLDSEIDLLQRTVQLRQENLDLVNSLFKNGQVAQLDVARATTELEVTQADAIGLEKLRAETENALAILTGQPASVFTLESSPLDPVPPAVAAGLPSSLLERRPDVATAERVMAAANARIGIAKTAFFPSIRLTGSTGFESTEFADLLDWDNHTWGFGPSISLPIFEAGRNAARLEQAKAAHSEAVANYRSQVLVAFHEVENSLAGLSILARQAEAQSRAAQAARQAADLSAKRYRAGRVSYLEVVDSERTALQTAQKTTQIIGQRYQASVSLIKALGGGWQARQAGENIPPNFP